MKVVILAGGQRSAISNEQEGIPKPMVEIGGKPLLWHIMKSFSAYGLNDFVICGGYKVNMIKEYFMDYYIYQSDITVDLQTNRIEIHKNCTEDWKVTVVDTGLYSSTGQRVARIQEYIDGEEFIVAHGDCLFDVDVEKLTAYHRERGRIATMTVARPTGRNEALDIDADGQILKIQQNAALNEAWVNTGLYVLNRKAFDVLQGNYTLEALLTDHLAEKGELITYKHNGFWTPVETYRDMVDMENLWNAGIAPWAK